MADSIAAEISQMEIKTIQTLKKLAGTPEEALKWLKREMDAINTYEDIQHVGQLTDYYYGDQMPYLWDGDNTDSGQSILKRDYPLTFEQLAPSAEVSNIVAPVINRIAKLYAGDVKRTINGTEDDQKLFDWIAKNGKLNTAWDGLNRLESLTGTMHMRFWIDEDGDCHFDPIARNKLFVIPNSKVPTKADCIMYFTGSIETTPGNVVLVGQYWDKETYFVFHLSELGNDITIIPDDDNPDHINHYGVIPLVRVDTTIDQTEYFSDVNHDLLTAQNAVNKLLTEQGHAITMQAFSYPVLEGYKTNADSKVTTSPGVPIIIPLADGDQPQGKFYFETPSPKLTEMSEEVTNKMVRLARSFGLPDNSFTTGSGDVSGVSLWMQAVALRERTNRQRVYYEEAEEKLAQIIMKVWNYNADILPDGHPMKKKKFSEGATFSIDIPESRAEQDPESRRADWEFRFDNALARPVDYYMNELGMTEEDATKFDEDVRAYRGNQTPETPITPIV